MTSTDITRLRALLSDEQILQIATEFPIFRIPLKKIQMMQVHEKFLAQHDGKNTRELARSLGIQLSTAYNWLSDRSISHHGQACNPGLSVAPHDR